MITIKEYNEPEVNEATANAVYVKFNPGFSLNDFEDIFDGRNYIRPVDFEFKDYIDGYDQYQQGLEAMLTKKFKNNDIQFDLTADERGLEGWIFADDNGFITKILLDRIIRSIEDFGITVNVIVRYENGKRINDTLDIFYQYDIVERK